MYRYKVEVNDEILTFRPSALRSYNGNETYVSSAYLDTYQQELSKEKEIKAEKVIRAKTGLRYNSIKKERKKYQRKTNNASLSTLSQCQWLNTEVRDSQGLLGRVSNVLENGQVIVISSTDGAEKIINPNQLAIMRSKSEDDSDNDNETESADDNESIDDLFPTTTYGKRSRKISTIIHRKRNISQEKYRRSLLPISATDIDLVQNIMKTIMSPEFEKEAINEFMTGCCQTCFAEKWNGAKFCWNENCITSPIYWKRTGGRSMDSMDNDKRPMEFIESLQENMEISNIISIPEASCGQIKVEMAQTPKTIPNKITIECYRPMNNNDNFINSYHSGKARSDSNVTDLESFSPSFSPLPKCDDYDI